jgi:hypothetical protein
MAEGLLTLDLLHESSGKEKKQNRLPATSVAESQVHPDAATLLAEAEAALILDVREIETQRPDGTASKGLVDKEHIESGTIH